MDWPRFWMAFGISLLFLAGVFWLMLFGAENRDDFPGDI